MKLGEPPPTVDPAEDPAKDLTGSGSHGARGEVPATEDPASAGTGAVDPDTQESGTGLEPGADTEPNSGVACE